MAVVEHFFILHHQHFVCTVHSILLLCAFIHSLDLIQWKCSGTLFSNVVKNVAVGHKELLRYIL